MRKILFFTEHMWAFGSIHTGLSKYLFAHGVNADILNWSISYQLGEMEYISNAYDFFVTTPPGLQTPGLQTLSTYGIPYDRIILVAHAQWDLLLTIQTLGGVDAFNEVHDYAVVSDDLKQKSKEFGITRIPKVVPVGVVADDFVRPVPAALETIGYGGAIRNVNFAGEDIKRGYLVEQVAERTETALVGGLHYHYFGMPSFYESVDAVMMSSTEESVGLPMLEAACAGRLTLGTPAGYYRENAGPSGGIMLPLPEDEYMDEAVRQIEFYKANPDAYQERCSRIQDYARRHYDWSNHIGAWAELLKG